MLLVLAIATVASIQTGPAPGSTLWSHSVCPRTNFVDPNSIPEGLSYSDLQFAEGVNYSPYATDQAKIFVLESLDRRKTTIDTSAATTTAVFSGPTAMLTSTNSDMVFVGCSDGSVHALKITAPQTPFPTSTMTTSTTINATGPSTNATRSTPSNTTATTTTTVRNTTSTTYTETITTATTTTTTTTLPLWEILWSTDPVESDWLDVRVEYDRYSGVNYDEYYNRQNNGYESPAGNLTYRIASVRTLALSPDGLTLLVGRASGQITAYATSEESYVTTDTSTTSTTFTTSSTTTTTTTTDALAVEMLARAAAKEEARTMLAPGYAERMFIWSTLVQLVLVVLLILLFVQQRGNQAESWQPSGGTRATINRRKSRDDACHDANIWGEEESIGMMENPMTSMRAARELAAHAANDGGVPYAKAYGNANDGQSCHDQPKAGLLPDYAVAVVETALQSPAQRNSTGSKQQRPVSMHMRSSGTLQRPVLRSSASGRLSTTVAADPHAPILAPKRTAKAGNLNGSAGADGPPPLINLSETSLAMVEGGGANNAPTAARRAEPYSQPATNADEYGASSSNTTYATVIDVIDDNNTRI